MPIPKHETTMKPLITEQSVEQNKYYCDCTNHDCGAYYMIMDPDDKCPECGSPVEPSQCDDGW